MTYAGIPVLTRTPQEAWDPPAFSRRHMIHLPGCVLKSKRVSSSAGFLLTSKLTREISIKIHLLRVGVVFHLSLSCLPSVWNCKGQNTFLPVGTELVLPQTSLCLITVANTVARSASLGLTIKKAAFFFSFYLHNLPKYSQGTRFSMDCSIKYLRRFSKLNKILFNTACLQRTEESMWVVGSLILLRYSSRRQS